MQLSLHSPNANPGFSHTYGCKALLFGYLNVAYSHSCAALRCTVGKTTVKWYYITLQLTLRILWHCLSLCVISPTRSMGLICRLAGSQGRVRAGDPLMEWDLITNDSDTLMLKWMHFLTPLLLFRWTFCPRTVRVWEREKGNILLCSVLMLNAK